MKIFYLDIDEFLKTHDDEFLLKFSDDRIFRSKKRFLQYSAGRFLVKTAAEKFFAINNTEIIIDNNKPKFINGGIYFSITHCANIIAAAFDSCECGLDIEEIKDRDFIALGERYGKKFYTAEEFYEFWTEYEAGIKLQSSNIGGKYTAKFLDKFILSAVSTGDIQNLTILKFQI